MAPVDLGEQSVLAAEVVADERPVHARLGGNRAHRDAGEAAFGEQSLGGGQQLLAGLRAGALGRRPVRLRRAGRVVTARIIQPDCTVVQSTPYNAVAVVDWR